MIRVHALVQAIVTIYCKLGGWKQQNFFSLTVLEAGKYKIKALADLVCNDSLLPSL